MDKLKEDIIAYAEAFMSADEIGTILELSEEDLSSEEFKRYFNTGFLKSKYTVQQSIVNLAGSGSSPAQTIATTLINKLSNKILIDG
jgi:hypothetical protein